MSRAPPVRPPRDDAHARLADFPLSFRQALAVHEILRRAGICADDIFVGVKQKNLCVVCGELAIPVGPRARSGATGGSSRRTRGTTLPKKTRLASSTKPLSAWITFGFSSHWRPR